MVEGVFFSSSNVFILAFFSFFSFPFCTAWELGMGGWLGGGMDGWEGWVLVRSGSGGYGSCL